MHKAAIQHINANIRIFILSGLMLLGSLAVTQAQVKLTLTQGAKNVYNTGDKVEVTIEVSVPPETCADGLEQVELFQSGIDIERQSNWTEIRKGLWIKKINITISGNKKGYGMLTVIRRTDKQSFTFQQRFDYKQ
jgi:hypothetical protein